MAAAERASSSTQSSSSTRSTSPIHVFLAEFDINLGSFLKHQYPPSTGLDEHLMAEHMLPDGAHDREQDWTVFFLNQIPALSFDLVGGKEGEKESERLYTISLVRTKKDPTVKRGAVVKALAVATKWPFLQIWKPLLIQALETYYVTPTLQTLIQVHTTIASLDLSLLPTLSRSERIVLRTSERGDLFEDKVFNSAPSGTGSGGARDSTGTSTTNGVQPIPGTAKGIGSGSGSAETASVVESIGSGSGVEEILGAITTGETNLDAATSTTSNILRPSYSSESISSLASSTRNGALPTTSSTSASRGRADTGSASSIAGGATGALTGTGPAAKWNAMMIGGRRKDSRFWETRIDYDGLVLPIRIPMARFDEEVGDYSLISLITSFPHLTPSPPHPHLHSSGASTPPLIVLFNALLTHKRVLFLGHGHSAGDVADRVLAACALGSGCGIEELEAGGALGRAFPYTMLGNLEGVLATPGYIAGVCNPAFGDKTAWWDVLCDITTGKITVSKDIAWPSTTSQTTTHSTPLPHISSSAASVNGSVTSGGIGSGGVGGVGEDGHLETGTTVGGDKDVKTTTNDLGFMEDLTNSIQNHYGESIIRSRISEYVRRVLRLTAKYEEETGGIATVSYPCKTFRGSTLGSGCLADEIVGVGNAGRIEGWKVTEGFRKAQVVWKEKMENDLLDKVDIAHQLGRMRAGKKMGDKEAEMIMRTLSGLASRGDEEIVAILAHLPAHFGGLLPLSFGLFHPKAEVRWPTVEFLDLLNDNPTGKVAVAGLNAFHRSAYTRLSQEHAMSPKSPTGKQI